MKILLLFLCSLALAQHDHSLHVDSGFISGEARRVGWLSLDGIESAIKDYVDALKLYETKHSQFFANPKEGEAETVQQIWKEQFEPNLRGTVDRLLIAVNVCRDVYDSPTCEVADDAFDIKLDTRGPEFREEFIREIHRAIKDEVSLVKKARNDLRNEL